MCVSSHFYNFTLSTECKRYYVEMIDNSVYSILELSSAPQDQNDQRQKQKAFFSRSSLFCYVAIAFGLLNGVLVSLIISQWILCQSSKHSTCASCPSCPDLWMRYGDHCYYFSLEEKDWNSSLEFCLAKDSHLLMLKDNQEMNLLKNFLNKSFYWIGLRNSSGWRWEDGSALNFSRVLSNSLVQKCGAMNEDGLQASSCEVLLRWLCKKVRL